MIPRCARQRHSRNPYKTRRVRRPHRIPLGVPASDNAESLTKRGGYATHCRRHCKKAYKKRRVSIPSPWGSETCATEAFFGVRAGEGRRGLARGWRALREPSMLAACKQTLPRTQFACGERAARSRARGVITPSNSVFYSGFPGF